MSVLIEPTQESPAVTYDLSAEPLLTSASREVLQGILTLLAQQVRERQIPVGPIRIMGTPDSAEAPVRLLVVLQIALPLLEAMACWDTFGDAVEQWAASLPPVQAGIALDQIALDVQWDSRDSDI